MNKIFFGESGLTCTSANHIANLAKERIADLESWLANISFTNTTISLIGSSEKSLIESGITEEELKLIPEKIIEVANMKSLIAWLREAIKAKERLYKEELNQDFDSDLTYPVKGHILTEEEYYESLSLKERNRYYQLEAIAATIGKYIHQKGTYSIVRKKFYNKLSTPNSYELNGRDTIITTSLPSVDKVVVDEVFFKLQSMFREYQAELNSMKFKCETAVKQSKIQVEEEFEVALSAYKSSYDKLYSEFQKQQSLNLRAIDNLKIVIPVSLQATYESLK